VSQQSNGEGTAPALDCSDRRRSARAPVSRVTTTPPMTSECPDRYLVVECIATSIPRASGRCRKGVAQVLSQALSAPAARAMAATSRRSVTAMVGLDGVSAQTNRVLGRTAARTDERSVMSTKDASSPQRAKCSRSSLPVP
jgi:hypothetical protein